MILSPLLNRLVLVGVVLALAASMAIAYGGGPPSVLGHSAEEVDFVIDSVVQDCTAGAGTICTAQCPVPPGGSNYSYKILSGSCITADAVFLRAAGGCSGSGCGPTGNQWYCSDASHTSGKLFRSHAYCLRGGI